MGEATVLIRERTRRRETEEQLARAESRYHELVDNLNVGVFRSTLGPHGRFLEANPALVEMLEAASKAQLLPHSVTELYADPAKRQAHARELEASGALQAQEVEMLTLRGRRFWGRISARMKTGPDGLQFYDGVLEDITHRKEVADALRRQRLFMRTVLNNLPDVIYAKDTECRKVLTNVADLEIMGCKSEEEALGKTDLDFYSRQAALRFMADDKLVLESGLPVLNKEEHFIDLKGRQRTLLTSKLPLRDEVGRVTGLVGIGHDITERERVEEALRESQERLALVIEGSNDGIWDWDLRKGEIYFSPQWKRMLGYDDTDIANQFGSWKMLLHPDDRRGALAHLRGCLKGAATHFELEHRLRHKDGNYRWILARGVIRRDAQGRPVRMAGSHVDLTERKLAMERLRKAYAELAANAQVLKSTLHELRRSNEQLKKAQLQLIQAAKLETVGTLAAGIAHEVKNPLQVLLMGVDYLGNNLRSNETEIRAVLDDMRDGVGRASAIITELLQLSGAREFSMTEEDLNTVVERALWLVHNEVVASHSHTDAQLAPNLPRVRIDRGKMEQVLINLFLNALQAMTGGGVLSVRTRIGVAGEDLDLTQHAFRRFVAGEPLIFLDIGDTGPGITEENLPKIFDPFFTTKPVGVGTGLGLSVVRQIVDLHGGAIDVRNHPPHGVLVTLVLQCRDREDCAPGSVQPRQRRNADASSHSQGINDETGTDPARGKTKETNSRRR